MRYSPRTMPAASLLRRRDFHRTLGSAALAGLAMAGCSAPGAQDFEQLWTRLRGIAVGRASADQRLAVFFDTRCGYCRQLWQELAPVQDQLLVLWTPVAILAPASRNQALGLLASANPAQALSAHMRGRARLPDAEGAPGLEAALDGNLAALESLPGASRSVPQIAGLRHQALQVVRGAAPLAHLQQQFALSTPAR